MPSVQHNGLSIHYTDQGAGPPLVLGHSFLCSGEMWEKQLPALAQHYRVINIDARGHGNSSPIVEAFSIYDMVDDVLAVMDHLNIHRAVWAGLSIGGMVAMRAALTAPERVEALMLLDTDAGTEKLHKRIEYATMAFMVRLVGVRGILGMIAWKMFGSSILKKQPELVAEWKQHFSRMHVPSALFMLQALQTRDSLIDRLPQIDVPTMVLVGTEDRSLPPVRSRTIHSGIPGAEIVEVPGAGHLSCLEQPKIVTEAMLSFMANLVRQQL